MTSNYRTQRPITINPDTSTPEERAERNAAAEAALDARVAGIRRVPRDLLLSDMRHELETARKAIERDEAALARNRARADQLVASLAALEANTNLVCSCTAELLQTAHHTTGCPLALGDVAPEPEPAPEVDPTESLTSFGDVVSALDTRRDVHTDREAKERANIIRHGFRNHRMTTDELAMASGLHRDRIAEIVGIRFVKGLMPAEGIARARRALPAELPEPTTSLAQALDTTPGIYAGRRVEDAHRSARGRTGRILSHDATLSLVRWDDRPEDSAPVQIRNADLALLDWA